MRSLRARPLALAAMAFAGACTESVPSPDGEDYLEPPAPQGTGASDGGFEVVSVDATTYGGMDAGLDARSVAGEAAALAAYGEPCVANADCADDYCLASGFCSRACTAVAECLGSDAAPNAEWLCLDVPLIGSRCACDPTLPYEICDGLDNNCDTLVDRQGDASCGPAPGTLVASIPVPVAVGDWGSSRSFSLHFDGGAPIADVTVPLHVSGPYATVTSSVVFRATDFSRSQLVTVTGLPGDGRFDPSQPFTILYGPIESDDLQYAHRTGVATTGARLDVDSLYVSAGGDGLPSTDLYIDVNDQPTALLDGNGGVVVYNSEDPMVTGSGFAEVVARTVTGNAALASVTTSGGAMTTASTALPTSVSEDGRYVVFTSDGDLQSGTDVDQNVFLRDTVSNTTQQLNTTSNEFTSEQGAISPDGAAVAFVTNDATVVGFSGNDNLIIVTRPLTSTAFTVVGLPTDGSNSTSDALDPVLSSGGCYVAFDSMGSGLVSGATPPFRQVYLFDTLNHTYVRVSQTATGAVGDGESYGPRITPDGRYVAFLSEAQNLGGSRDTNVHVLVKDLTTNQITVASIGPEGDAITQPADEAQISDDGRYVGFVTGEVYVRDMVAGTTTLESAAADGSSANAPCSGLSMSADGNYVSFFTQATNLDPLVTHGAIFRMRRR